MRDEDRASDEEEADTHHTDDGADDFARGDTLVKEDGGRRYDEDGREGEEGLGDAGGGVHGGEQRHADPHEGSEDGGTENAPHGTAVGDSVVQLLDSVLVEEEQQQGEAQQTHGGSYHGGGKGDADVEGHRHEGVGKGCMGVKPGSGEVGIVVFETYLAKHQPETLTDSSHTGVGYPLFGEAELEVGSMNRRTCGGVALGEDGHADTRQRDAHAHDSQRAHLLADKQAPHDGGGGGREGHEELTEARADIDIALHKAVVANHIAHHTRKEQPEPCRPVGETGPRDTHHQPEGDSQQREGHDHAHHIEWQGAHALGRHFGKKCSDRPREGHKE